MLRLWPSAATGDVSLHAETSRPAPPPRAEDASLPLAAHLFEESSTLVSSEALLRETVHPPCPDETVEFTLPSDRTSLALVDRLSLRIGLWLLLRAERARTVRGDLRHEEVQRLLAQQHVSRQHAMALLTYDLQRHLR